MPTFEETGARSPLRLFILGATGRTGRALLEQARARGHLVTAFVRSPDKLSSAGANFTVVPGDPRDADALLAAMTGQAGERGHDAVLSALGPPGLGRSTILSDSARAAVRAMKSSDVKRLLIVSAAVLFDQMGVAAALLRHTLLRHVAHDSALMEGIVAASGLNWTIVRPPRLTDGAATGDYVVADERFPVSGSRVTRRAAVARFMLDELERPAHVHRVVGVTSPQRNAAQEYEQVSARI